MDDVEGLVGGKHYGHSVVILGCHCCAYFLCQHGGVCGGRDNQIRWAQEAGEVFVGIDLIDFAIRADGKGVHGNRALALPLDQGLA